MRSRPRHPIGVSSKLLLAATIANLSGLHTTIAHAQEDNAAPRLEEVIVTAQKREESLQDVPISVATVSGEKLEKAGIENLEDLTTYLPNIHFTETGISTQVRVRGIGSDNSQGFEQSVGMYVDGIYNGRAQLFRAPMMDMQRAELLRGPQSTLFGKNSIAGALNLTTARPTDELEGRISASHEFEFEGRELNGVISGPITENFRARLAARSYEDEGYFTNTYTGEKEPVKENTTVRLSLEWEPTEDLQLFFKGEQNEFDSVGRQIEITQDIPINSGGASYGEILTALGEPELSSGENYVRQTDLQDSSSNEITNYTFIANYDFNDHTLTYVGGLLEFDYTERCDCDDTASEILDLSLAEQYEQTSHELRIASPTDTSVDWIAGIYYQEYDQTFEDVLRISPDNFLVAALSSSLSDTGLRRDFHQTSEALSFFARTTWHVNHKLHLTLGARYSEEDKTAEKALNLIYPSTNEISTDPLLGWIYLNAFQVESVQATTAFLPTDPVTVVPLVYSGHDVEGERSESAFTPLVNVEYNVSDDIMTYASYTQGFKAGGFDPRSNRVGNYAAPQGFAPASEANSSLHFEFEEEKANAYELGMKSTLADGRVELNLALFRTDYEDLQISQFDGGVGFNVGNAKETQVQGLELDGRWAITDGLTASYGFSWLDFEFKDFKNGNCYAGQPPDGIDLDGDSTIDTCDYTGKRGVYTPDYTINLSFDYRRNLFNDIDLVSFLDFQQIDSQQVHVNLDPTGEIDGYMMINARLGIETEHWSLALLGKNLTDEHVASYSGNAPLSDSTFMTNTHYSFIRKPRTIAVEASYKF